ncbi:MAG: FAD-dependent oxidoreductase [Spirochaetia bacterium]
MSRDKWKEIGSIEDFSKDTPVKITEGGDEIMIIRRDSDICACGGTCTHYGGPLDEGVYKDGNIVCPWHNARFDVKSGELRGAPALDDIPVYEIKTENGKVFLGSKNAPEIVMPGGTDSRRFVIIGAGAAAEGAAEELRRSGFAGKITVITPEEDTPYDRTILSKGFVSGEMKESYLPLRKKDFYEKLNIDFQTGKRVKKLETGSKEITLDDGEKITGDQILIATGSIPNDLEIPGKAGANYHLLRSADSGRKLKQAAADAKKILLIGASFIAMELAADLVSHGKEVHIAAPEQIPMVQVFGERIGNRILRMHTAEGVNFHLGQTVKEFLNEKGRITGAVLSDGETVQTDLVITAVGVRPAVNFLESSGLVKNGAVPVNEYLETSQSGIFAAGDITVVPFQGAPKPVRVEHWSNALNQGRHAAKSMLGEKEPYGKIPFFWTRQYGKSIKFSGFPLPWDQIAYRGKPDDGNFVAGFYSRNKLQGAASSGMMEEMITMEKIIHEGQDLSYGDFGNKELPI